MYIFLVPIRNFNDISKSIRHVVKHLNRINKFLITSNHSSKKSLEMYNKLLLIVFFIIISFEFKHFFNEFWNVEVCLQQRVKIASISDVLDSNCGHWFSFSFFCCNCSLIASSFRIWLNLVQNCSLNFWIIKISCSKVLTLTLVHRSCDSFL